MCIQYKIYTYTCRKNLPPLLEQREDRFSIQRKKTDTQKEREIVRDFPEIELYNKYAEAVASKYMRVSLYTRNVYGRFNY